MDEKEELSVSFEKAMEEFPNIPSESIIEVNMDLLDSVGLTNEGEYVNPNEAFERSFKVIENANRITLFNNQFVIWIIPEILDGIPATYALIGLRESGGVKLEVVFLAKGPFNSSRLVLRLLDRYLTDIQENEELIHKIQRG
jgi:hypothetical protein